MKLDAKSLKNQLTKNLTTIYLISGDEPLQIRESVDAVRAAAKKSGFTERQIFNVETGFSWDQFALALESYSLFSEKTLIELHFAQTKISLDAEKILKAYAEKPAKDKLLLVVLPKLDASLQKKSWIKACEAAGILVQVWPIDAAHLNGWIEMRAESLGLRLSAQIIRLLVELGEGNLLAIAQTLEKLLLVFPDGKPTDEQVKQNLVDNARFQVFDLADSLLLSDTQRTMRLLLGLATESTEPLLVLWVLVKELKILYRIKRANSDVIFQQLGLWPKRIPLYKKAAQRILLEKIEEGLFHAQVLDCKLKSSQNRLVWDELKQIAQCFE